MAGQRIKFGPTGETVAHNLKRLRTGQNLTYTQIAQRLKGLGRPLSALAVRRMEEGERRIDTDDLMGLSVALGVNPNALLLPPLGANVAFAQITGVPSWLYPVGMWKWATGVEPLGVARTIERENAAVTDEQLEHERASFMFRVTPKAWVEPGTPNITAQIFGSDSAAVGVHGDD